MKPLHISYILMLSFLLPAGSFSQPAPQPATATTPKLATADTARRVITDTSKASAVANPNDDEFNVFLSVFAIGFVAVIAGAALFGTIAFARRPANAILIGASAGLLGDLLLGFILLNFLRIFLEYCQRKLSF